MIEGSTESIFAFVFGLSPGRSRSRRGRYERRLTYPPHPFRIQARQTLPPRGCWKSPWVGI